MAKINNYTTLCLIDNFACTRSVDNEIRFHCFADNCMFETVNLGTLLEHLDVHKVKWLGFCYTCNDEITDHEVPLLQEVQHWNNCHRDQIGISVAFQPGDKQNELKDAVDIAKAKCLGSEDVICLKPWNNATSNTQESCRRKLSKRRLYALFKCMDRNCSFSTSCGQSMLIHLEYHEKSAANAAISDISQLECAYCDLIINRSSLVQHIQEEHSSSTYQCPYCFYRSCSACNVAFHLKTFHESRVKSILVCREKKLHPVTRTVVEENRSKHVFPLRCSDGCNEKTYRMDYFIHHLNAAHDNFKCQFCGSNFPTSEALQHLRNHNIGVYQCIYCLYGTNDLASIHNHMCHTHPTRMPHVCVRLTRKHRILRDAELTSVESTLISQLSQPVHPKWLKMCPFTYEELLNDPVQLTTVDANPGPSSDSMAFHDLNQELRLISNDPSFDDEDILNYDELKRDYWSDDWNEYFTTNRLQLLLQKEWKMYLDEAFYDKTFTNTTISQTDRSELLDFVKDENICDDNLMLDSGFPISDDDISRSEHSTSLNKKETKVKIESATEQFTKLIEPKLSDVFRYRCAYCPKLCTNLQLVYEHWKKEHVKPNAEFIFQIMKIFKCCYCRYCNIFDDLKHHCQQKHPKETFAIIDKINPKNCALCTNEFRNSATQLIADHFKQHHTVAGMNDMIRLESYLTDEWLEEVIAEPIIQRSRPLSSQILYGCPHCPAARCNDQMEMVEHIRKHFVRFKCNFCVRSFEKIEMLRKHRAIAHHAQDEALSVLSANDNLGNYLEMKIIFPNGLMLTKRECVNTRFGAMDELVKMVQELNGSDLATEDKQQTQSERISQPLKKAMITRSKAKTRSEESHASSNLLPNTKSGCNDDVDRKKKRGRPRVVDKLRVTKESSSITYGITTRKRSNENRNRK